MKSNIKNNSSDIQSIINLFKLKQILIYKYKLTFNQITVIIIICCVRNNDLLSIFVFNCTGKTLLGICYFFL